MDRPVHAERVAVVSVSDVDRPVSTGNASGNRSSVTALLNTAARGLRAAGAGSSVRLAVRTSGCTNWKLGVWPVGFYKQSFFFFLSPNSFQLSY